MSFNAQDSAANSAADSTAIDCLFSRVFKNGRPALLAQFQIDLDLAAAETSSEPALEPGRVKSLLQHADILNTQLPLLRISLRHNDTNNYGLVLHGFLYKRLTRSNTAHFLRCLTQDFETFLTYARTHGLPLTLPLVDKMRLHYAVAKCCCKMPASDLSSGKIGQYFCK